MSYALVTGASSGIGRELCKLLARDGHDLVVVARRRERLEALANTLEADFGVNVLVETADLSDPDAPSELFERLQTQNVQVDILVNNAGFGTQGRFWELDREGELDEIQLNVSAVADLTHLFVEPMVERGDGKILNIASTAAFQPGPFMSTYFATKSFVLHFTEGLAYELRVTGVSATVHCPGATETEFAEKAGNDDSLLFQAASVATPEAVAGHAYRSMLRGKTVAIHGWMNKLTAFITRFSPRSAVRWLTAKLNQ
jgi:hypothetical protein